jgi:hypothetical protein
MTRREQLYPEIQRLREVEGLMWREIAERLDIALPTAHEYYSDPDGVGVRARKAKTDGACVDCGARTVSDGGRAPERCRTHSDAHTRAVSRKWILDSFAEWHRIFGVPPTASEWNPASCRLRTRQPGDGPARALARYEFTGRPWPAPSLICRHFGTWNDAVRAAGFEPLAPNERWVGRRGIELRRQDEAVAA